MSVESAIKAGEFLTEAKDQLKHGQWLPWLRDHCDLPDRTARLYMRLARHKEELAKSATVADLTIRGALEVLDVDARLAAHAKAINAEWADYRAAVTEMMTSFHEARLSFKDDGGDEAFKAWVATEWPLSQHGVMTYDDLIVLLDLSKGEWPDAASDALLEALLRKIETTNCIAPQTAP